MSIYNKQNKAFFNEVRIEFNKHDSMGILAFGINEQFEFTMSLGPFFNQFSPETLQKHQGPVIEEVAKMLKNVMGEELELEENESPGD